MNMKTFAPITVLALLIVGCSSDSSSPTNTSSPPSPSFVVTPADGQSGVPLDASVTLTFAQPVDRAVVERALHLISQRDMADSLCPVDTTMGHGMMGTTMMDSTMMNHLMRRHATSGRFFWDAAFMECTFRPDSMMIPRTQYMIHMGGEMMRMIRDRMGEMGSMGGHFNPMMVDEVAYHFMTMDTTGTGGGHGHH